MDTEIPEEYPFETEIPNKYRQISDTEEVMNSEMPKFFLTVSEIPRKKGTIP